MRLAASAFAFLLLFACSPGVEQKNTEQEEPTAAPSAAPEPDPTINVSRGLPEWLEDNPGEMAVGIDADGNLVVITFGSSSNPERVVAATHKEDTISVVIAAEDGPSTMDYAPTTSVVTFAEPLSATEATRVDLGKFGTVKVGPERQALAVVPEL